MPTITVIKVPMHGFKSAILEKLKNCQNDTFEPMQFDFFGQKHCFEALRKWQIEKMFITCPNPGFMQKKKIKLGIF